MKKIVSIFGPPGSGKGTQADRLARSFEFEHIDTGKLIERTVHGNEFRQDPVIERERALFDGGRLNTPEWVTEIVKKEIHTQAERGRGIVFSGSPRTLYEAENLLPIFEELYGKDNIVFIRITVRSETSIFRNTNRRICRRCGTPLLYSEETEKIAICPCGGKIVTRTLDNPEAIAIRLQEYANRTKPIFEFIKNRGYTIYDVDGEPDPDTVAKSILGVFL